VGTAVGVVSELVGLALGVTTEVVGTKDAEGDEDNEDVGEEDGSVERGEGVGAEGCVDDEPPMLVP
jgi:hypothetical protein